METITLTNTFQDDPQYNPCTQLVADTPLPLNRTISGTPPNTSSLSLWFKIEESAILKLGTANDCLQIASDGMALVANGTSATLDTIATAGEWHHLVWVKKDDEHTLYLNGIACQTQTLTGAPNPATINEITSVGAAAYVVHIHAYDRALEATEVVADKMSQYNATKSFTDQYPIDFALKDKLTSGNLPDNKLIINTSPDVRTQRLSIVNTSGEVITLNASSEDTTASKNNYHFELRLRNGTFSEPDTYPTFTGLIGPNLDDQTTDWSITRADTQNPDDGSWSVYFLRKTQGTLVVQDGDDTSLDFTFQYKSADGALGSRSTRVGLNYNHIQFEDGQLLSGNRVKQVDVLSLSSAFPLTASVLCLKEDNSEEPTLLFPAEGMVINESGDLIIQLTNNGLLDMKFTAQTQFKFKLPLGNKASDLADESSELGNEFFIKNDLSEVWESHNENTKSEGPGSTVLFTWTPGEGEKIPPQSKRLFKITPITPNSKTGFSTIYVEYEDLPGYADGRLSVIVPKITRDISQLVGGGNVGIGIGTTTSPSAKLHISETTGTTHSVNNGTLILDHENSGGASSIVFRSKNNRGSDYGYIQYQDDSSIGGTGESARLIIGTSNDAADDLILSPTGNVGIGTTVPGAKLEVNGDLKVRSSMTIGGPDNRTAKLIISALNARGSHSYTSQILMQGYSDRAQGIYFNDIGHPDERWFAGITHFTGFGTYSIGYDAEGGAAQHKENSLLTVKGSNGNVGIGTSRPSAKLEVNGVLKVNGAVTSPEGTLRDDGGGWIRTYGSTGWYSQTYGGGWYMQDSTWIRSYGSKSIYHNSGTMRTDGTFQVGGSGSRFLVKTDGNVGIGTTSPNTRLHVDAESGQDAFRVRVNANSKLYTLSNGGTGIGGYSTTVPENGLYVNGSVGIGTTSPIDKLHVNGIFRQTYGGNTFRMWQDSRNLIFNLKNTHYGSNRSMRWDGDTNWDSYSDRRLKTNIEEEKNILKRLTQLKVKNFNWKDDPNNKRKMIGFIAQDVQPLFPTLVKENNDENSNEKKLTIPYASFGVLAVGAIKELKDEKDVEITAMQQEISDLEEKNKEQAELLNKQQQQLLELSRKVEDLLRQ